MIMDLLSKIARAIFFCIIIYIPLKLLESIITFLIMYTDIFNPDFRLLVILFINLIYYVFWGYYLSKYKRISWYEILTVVIIGIMIYMIPYILLGQNFYKEEYAYMHIFPSIFTGNYTFNSYTISFFGTKSYHYELKEFLVYIISIFYTQILLMIGVKLRNMSK